MAIASEEEDGRIYTDIAEGLGQDNPAAANVFTDKAVRRAIIGSG